MAGIVRETSSGFRLTEKESVEYVDEPTSHASGHIIESGAYGITTAATFSYYTEENRTELTLVLTNNGKQVGRSKLYVMEGNFFELSLKEQGDSIWSIDSDESMIISVKKAFTERVLGLNSSFIWIGTFEWAT